MILLMREGGTQRCTVASSLKVVNSVLGRWGLGSAISPSEGYTKMYSHRTVVWYMFVYRSGEPLSTRRLACDAHPDDGTSSHEVCSDMHRFVGASHRSFVLFLIPRASELIRYCPHHK